MTFLSDKQFDTFRIYSGAKHLAILQVLNLFINKLTIFVVFNETNEKKCSLGS